MIEKLIRELEQAKSGSAELDVKIMVANGSSLPDAIRTHSPRCPNTGINMLIIPYTRSLDATEFKKPMHKWHHTTMERCFMDGVYSGAANNRKDVVSTTGAATHELLRAINYLKAYAEQNKGKICRSV